MREIFTARYLNDWSGQIALLSPGYVPSVDFYLTPRFANHSSSVIHRYDSRKWDNSALSLPLGTFVVIVRHASQSWLRFLAAQSGRWSGVAFLFDDDLENAWRCQALPLDYRLRTSARFLLASHLLKKTCDRSWASTEELRQRYSHWAPTHLPPLNPFPIRSAAPVGVRRWCYHGTRAHSDEMRWLKPIVAEVHRNVADAEFEIMGGNAVKRMFAGIPRVSVLAPRSWPDYIAHCNRSEIAIGVAPLLPGRFNAARAHVKIYDIAHCGAVGVYSRREPYFPALAEAGAIFSGDDQAEWSRIITELLADDIRRHELYQQTSTWLAHQAVDPDLPTLLLRSPSLSAVLSTCHPPSE